MLISPPFLPAQQANQNEEEWLGIANAEGEPGDGAFPVSFNMGWHGGAHLVAPINGNASERVRAIADGTVVFKRSPTARQTDEKHPLNYRGGWTDDGCVVLRHETAIGSGATAADIVYFSIYMHLSLLHVAIKEGTLVSRKDELGQAGQIYGGLTRKIHFEIVSDDANTEKLLGRLTGGTDTTKHGRADAVYGDCYFHLPIGTLVYAARPLPHLIVAHVQPAKPTPNALKPPIAPVTAVFTSTSPLVVGLATSRGAVEHLGDVKVTTYLLSGEVVGTPLREDASDYLAFDTAVAISNAFPAATRPAPSALFEMLRFGRVINTENESLPDTGIPHWRRINYPSGSGWVDLNTPAVTKYSDADFPQWRGWSLVDDSVDGDSRCDSSLIKSWLASATGAKQTPAQTVAALRDPAVAKKMGKAVCKFSSEWTASTIDQRWGWLKEQSDANPTALIEEDFTELKAHINALCFGVPALATAQWHWPPTQFLKHFRSCGWLSEKELVRCIPAAYQTERQNRGSPIDLIRVTQPTAQQRITKRNPVVLMQICRKYGIVTPLRLAHFFAQIYRETGLLQWDQELASGAEYEGRADLGNVQPGDGIRFKGRGLMQTTGRANYKKFSQYRGKVGSNSFEVEPNNFLLATNEYNCADTSGLYWVSRRVASANSINIHRVADRGVGESDLRAVTKNVNGAEDGLYTGLVARRSHLNILAALLLDGFPEIAPALERRNV